MTEERIQQFLNWLSDCEAKEQHKRMYVVNYSWEDHGRWEAFRNVKEMFQIAFKEELE